MNNGLLNSEKYNLLQNLTKPGTGDRFRNMKTKIGLFLLLVLLSTPSCSVKQKIQRINLNKNGSGSLKIRLGLNPVLIYYINLIRPSEHMIEEPLNEAVFETSGIKPAFLKNEKYIECLRAYSPSIDSLDLDLKFSSINKIFTKSQGIKKIISFYKYDNKSVLELHLERRNFSFLIDRLLGMFSGGDEEFITSIKELLEPDTSGSVLTSDLEWALEDVAEEVDLKFKTDKNLGKKFGYPPGFKKLDVKSIIQSSKIILEINVDGRIYSHSGGKLLNEAGTLHIEIPLIRILSLETPLDYRIVFN